MMHIELVGCKLNLNNTIIDLFCYYCPPNATLEAFKFSLNCFESVRISDICLIFGDFNHPSIDWSKPFDCKLPKAQAFSELCIDLGLVQVNNYPTRINNILDLVLTNDPLIISSLNVGAPFSTSESQQFTS